MTEFNRGTLLIRADADVAMGTGHVMRCLALAQAWQRAGARADFVMADVPSSLELRLHEQGIAVFRIAGPRGSEEDAGETAELAARIEAPWIVLDGYHFNADYQRSIQRSGSDRSDSRLLLIDDNGSAQHYYADLVVNQNPHAHENLYRNRERYTELLLGPQFAMLRHEFDPWRNWKREIPEAGRKILITMGGSDPDNLTQLAIEALPHAGVKNLDLTVVAGGGNPHSNLLETIISEMVNSTSHLSIRLLRNVSNMPELMASADLALVAAGGTLWELLFMGCPMMSFARDASQGAIVGQLASQGVLDDLGFPKASNPHWLGKLIGEFALSPHRRRKMSALGRELVDGRGASRICNRLIAHPVRTL